MKHTLLLLLAVAMISIGWKCGGGGSSQCSAPCTPGETYSIIYRDCCTGSVERFCFAGTLNFPRDINGGCDVFVVRRRFFGFFLTANPSSADLNAPPASVTISGQGMDGTYAMPKVEYFDGEGYFIGAVIATAIASDGSWLQAPVPDLSYVYSGTYTIRVTNMSSEGFYVDEVGSATMSCWGRDRPDSDGDGWFDDEDCYPYDYSRWDCNDPGCLDGSWCNVY
jgi:hypothetical protein